MRCPDTASCPVVLANKADSQSDRRPHGCALELVGNWTAASRYGQLSAGPGVPGQVPPAIFNGAAARGAGRRVRSSLHTRLHHRVEKVQLHVVHFPLLRARKSCHSIIIVCDEITETPI
jgi:hypothetical protein